MRMLPSLRETAYRLGNAPLVASHICRLAVETWDRVSPSDFACLYRKVRPITMCSDARLRGLYRAVRQVVAAGIEGDIVECGTARGGSAALMALTLQQMKAHRSLWLFDTFEGLPPPCQGDRDYAFAVRHTGTCRGTVEEVRENLAALGIPGGGIHLVKGLLQDTVAKADTHKIAVLHIDADWYDSVRTCLEGLYDKVVTGGIIQIDDYGFWQGARRAVDEFLAAHSPTPRMVRLDYSGRQLVKP